MLTAEEVQELYEKVTDKIYNYNSYHVWYSYGNEEWKDDGLSVSFEVYGTSDQGGGAEWTEYWGIDADGRIYGYDAVYENYEDFCNKW